MSLKNYSARTNAQRTPFDRIQKCLATHRAKQIMFDYNQNGQVIGIAFALDIEGRSFAYRLPARFENVAQILYGHEYHQLAESKKLQAYTTAWANIRDWVEVQMALIDTGMVKAEEVLLPYMVDSDSGKTYYEALRDSGFRLGLPPPSQRDDGVIEL